MKKSTLSFYFLIPMLTILGTEVLMSKAKPKSDEKHEVHWSYEGENGPENWADLDPSFQAAKTGKRQSPIDVTDSIVSELGDITINYEDTSFSILNNGHTIQVNCDEGNSIIVNEEVYKLLQFHFHTPSEHTKQGESFPMEVHFVHKREDGRLAVIGIFMQSGEKNDNIQKIWDNMPVEKCEPQSVDSTMNPKDLLPEGNTYYQYNGSLTTPPCTEGVLWLLLDEPIEISEDQIAAFQSIFKNNARPVQPKNERFILKKQ